MYAAQRLSHLDESVIREMTRYANQHEAINLSQGFPDFDPPPAVVEAGQKAIRDGHNQYTITWGVPDLRAKVAEVYDKWYDLSFNPDTDITITCGVTEAVISALICLVNPGDKVILVDPSHENYVAGIHFAGGEPLSVPLVPPRFDLDEEALRAAFAQKPKAIIFNNPHNPAGRVFDRATLQLMADLCIEHDTIAITDEIYEHILYDDHQHIPIATLPSMAERTITISGLTKTYACTGWRVAWAVTRPELCKSLRTVHDFLTICAPTPLQVASITALDLPDSYYVGLKQAYTARRDKMMDILAEAGFQSIQPEGAYYVMADYSNIQPDMDDVEFSFWYLKEKGVAVVPGSSFYKGNPALGQGWVRFAFAKKLETLEETRGRMLG